MRSDPKTRREARFFAGISFSHTNNVTNRATRGINNLNKATTQKSKTNDAYLTILAPSILGFSGCPGKDLHCIREIQPAIG